MIREYRERTSKKSKEENAIMEIDKCLRAWEKDEPGNISTSTMKTALKALREIKDYRDIGNIAKIKKLKNKDGKRQPKHLNKKYCDYKIDDEDIGNFYGVCPSCEQPLNFYWHQKYCGNCGQALVWRNLKTIISKKDLDKILK